MELGWAATIQAAIIGISTIVVRVMAAKDREQVKKVTARQDDLLKLKEDFKNLHANFIILRDAYFKDRPRTVDHRGPVKPGG